MFAQTALAALTSPTGNLLSIRNNTTAKVVASYADSSHAASNVNDESTFSYWSNRNNDYFFYDRITGDLSFPAAVSRIEVYMSSGVTFDLEYFDSTDWQKAGTFTTTSNGTNSFSVANISAQKWRLREFKTRNSNNRTSVQINEWRIYGVPGTVDPNVNVDDGEHWLDMATSAPDECFYSIGSSSNIYPKGTTPCPVGSVEKRNEGYLWGMTHYKDPLSDKIYFGSGSNVMCLAVQKYLLQSDPYFRRGDLTCEFDRNTLGYKDWRPPSLYIFNLKTNTLSHPTLPGNADLLRQFTTGFRAAGNHKGIVFIGGPNLDDSIDLFAFIGTTGQLIGATVLDYGYANMRRMRVINDELYIGVGGAESAGAVGEKGGAVLHWKGDTNAIYKGDLSTLFNFEVVGTDMDAEATELTSFENRLFVSSWPNEVSTVGGGVWRSPALPIDPASYSSKVLWQTSTGGKNASYLSFQSDGDLVLYSTSGARLWASNTANKGGVKAVLQDNGKLAVYDADGLLLWCSDPNWLVPHPRVNTVAIENATTLLAGDRLSLGGVLNSKTGHQKLTLTSAGNLELSERVIPWTRVWGADQYEPDPFVATTYGTGPLAEFDGWLYWGTMHVPSAPLIKYESVHGEQDTYTRGLLEKGFHREGSIFRGKNLGQSNQQIELLYGGQSLDKEMPLGYYPVLQNSGQQQQNPYGGWWFCWWCFPTTSTGPTFVNTVNKMGTPKYGKGGFGNPWNNYIWTMAVYNNDLYVGTMDHSEIVLEDTQYTQRLDISNLFMHNYGADLFKFDSANVSATPVSVDGLGNGYSYGFRTMAADDFNIWIGTAGNSNLNAKGGWHLIKFTANEIQPAGSMGSFATLMMSLLIGRRLQIRPRKNSAGSAKK